jgi:class 3 adenylate cyclase
MIEKLTNVLSDREKKETLAYMLSRVNDRGQNELLRSKRFADQFSSGNECEAFVMSVDIRRSTELMLRARSPQAFAQFLSSLALQLEFIIKDNYGVFDKCTGDGILAFFPLFYSGRDAGISAVTAAIRCHDTFRRHYKQNRSSFSSVLTDVGLGIGVDYGKTHLLRIADGLTVVGVPVVYACRLGGAPAGKTYLNQPAYEQLCNTPRAAFLFTEEALEIKHEGSILAYSVEPSGSQIEPTIPEWAVGSAGLERILLTDE